MRHVREKFHRVQASIWVREKPFADAYIIKVGIDDSYSGRSALEFAENDCPGCVSCHNKKFLSTQTCFSMVMLTLLKDFQLVPAANAFFYERSSE